MIFYENIFLWQSGLKAFLFSCDVVQDLIKLVNGYKPLTVFAKTFQHSLLQGPNFTFASSLHLYE